ncbi:hypothetical protein B0H11DRAFT_2197400 [Mycena galericulata]|nr:hypothetical protein B0H11DRAFT_2197400 [Mycena galericulata]
MGFPRVRQGLPSTRTIPSSALRRHFSNEIDQNSAQTVSTRIAGGVDDLLRQRPFIKLDKACRKPQTAHPDHKGPRAAITLQFFGHYGFYSRQSAEGLIRTRGGFVLETSTSFKLIYKGQALHGSFGVSDSLQPALCPQLQIVIQPDALSLSRSDSLVTISQPINMLHLPQFPLLKRIYWTESCMASGLLRRVLEVALNLEHLFLSDSATIKADTAGVLVFPPIPSLRSLGFGRFSSVSRILQGDLQHLTHFTCPPTLLILAHFPVLPSLHMLTISGTHTSIPFPRIFSCCLCLREIRYNSKAASNMPSTSKVNYQVTGGHPWLTESGGSSCCRESYPTVIANSRRRPAAAPKTVLS